MPPDGDTTGGLRTDRRGAALGLVVGPVAFVVAWVLAGASTAGYSPVDDAISRLAAVGAPHRAAMTAGFVVFGAGLAAGGVALRSSPLHRCAHLAVANAVATFVVAATPLERSDAIDALHGAAATVGYVTLAAIALVAAGPLRSLGRSRAATASMVVGSVSALCLAATAFVDANGLFQRLGLGVVDVYLVWLGIELHRGRGPVEP